MVHTLLREYIAVDLSLPILALLSLAKYFVPTLMSGAGIKL